MCADCMDRVASRFGNKHLTLVMWFALVRVSWVPDHETGLSASGGTMRVAVVVSAALGSKGKEPRHQVGMFVAHGAMPLW
jgi:hypothetical protein